MRRLAALALLFLSACSVTRGSGVVATERREVDDFDSIEVDGSGTVEVATGSEFSLVVEADDNVLPLLESQVSDHTLRLGTRPQTSYLTSNPVVFRVALPSLAAVAVEGSADVVIDSVEQEELEVRIDGSADVVASGSVELLTLVIDGSGDFAGTDLRASEVVVEVAGSGEASVWAVDALDAEVSGSGEIRYRGDPDRVSTDVSGSGEIAAERG